MTRQSKPINVIIHAPDDEESLRLIQEAVDELYAKMIFRELEKTDLTPKEKDLVIKHLIAKLESQ